MRTKVISTAGVVMYLNAKVFGRIRDFQWTVSTPRRTQYGIDSLQPVEMIPLGTKVVGQMTVYRTVGDAGAEGAVMTARLDEIPREQYFSLQLVDRMSQKVVFEARYCSVTNQSWSAPSKGIITGTISFEALDHNNEAKP